MTSHALEWGRGIEDERSPHHHRIEALFLKRFNAVTARTDRMVAYLMLVQWVTAVALAYWLSPLAWEGKSSYLHEHVYAALFLGGLITSLPVYLAFTRAGQTSTRYVVACGQMLWSALLIHITGGRIETHFHVFGSLAILAFYRDLKVLIPATIVVAVDHFVRGMLWPESVYGVANPEWWRFLEHAGWVVFIDVFLVMNCAQSYNELWEISKQHVDLEETQDRVVRMEKLAAVGQLAASVGHELRNPLAAIQNAQAYIARKLKGSNGEPAIKDPKVGKFLELMKRELDASNKIVSDLLDFSRTRSLNRTPTPLRPLIEEVIELVPNKNGVAFKNEISSSVPVPDLDKDLIRQVIVNLVQNAVEAMPEDRADGQVVVSAQGGQDVPWVITVADNGVGIPKEALDRVFQPLFSTKTRGTGLGLAVAASMVGQHEGVLRVASEVGKGTTFTIELPPVAS